MKMCDCGGKMVRWELFFRRRTATPMVRLRCKRCQKFESVENTFPDLLRSPFGGRPYYDDQPSMEKAA